MQSEQATPAWSEENSASFIAYGRFFNPERERQFEVIGDLVAAAVQGEAAPLFAELCCGAGDLAAFLLGRFPAARYLALDGSPAMLTEATKQCAAFRARLTTRQFDLGSDDWRRMQEQPRIVVSSLAVHHLDGAGKRSCSAICTPCWRRAAHSSWRTSCGRRRRPDLRWRRRHMSARSPSGR
ncbi:MAG: hypothetical protein C0484_17365 [Rhodospirillum sp.]|nr:hypothetical protein [Rhodospirillum sp.]